MYSSYKLKVKKNVLIKSISLATLLQIQIKHTLKK